MPSNAGRPPPAARLPPPLAGKLFGGPPYMHGPVRILVHGMGFQQDPSEPTDPGPGVKPPGMGPELAAAYSRMCHCEWVGADGHPCLVPALAQPHMRTLP